MMGVVLIFEVIVDVLKTLGRCSIVLVDHFSALPLHVNVLVLLNFIIFCKRVTLLIVVNRLLVAVYVVLVFIFVLFLVILHFLLEAKRVVPVNVVIVEGGHGSVTAIK